MAERLGVTPEQCVGLSCYKAVHGTDTPPDFCPHARTLLEGGEHATEVHEDRLGGDFLVTTTPMLSPEGKIEGTIHVAREITERKLAERERETVVEFLHLMNEAKGTADLVHAAAGFFHERSGCEAVGIRLKDGDDFPYYEARGFPEEFVRMENSLCARDAAGQPICNSAGYLIQECMCGNVIQGRFDASMPFFTLRGSFWTNCTTELLAGTTEADRQANTRNRCNGQGYESVALIALRVGEEQLGLLQLNDKRRGRFTPEIISLWERLADYLAVALAKTRAEEALYDLNLSLEQRVQERTIQLRALAVELAQTEERERKRLAQVLHDQLQQLLVAAKFSTASLQKRVGMDVQTEFEDVLDLLGQSIDASRSLTVELSPPILKNGGLAAGLMWLSRWMQEKHGIAVEVTAQDLPTSLSEDLCFMCFQAVRELLLNTVKHAGVASAQVLMTHELGRILRIVVWDKGKGFDPATQTVGGTVGGFGLFSIRERFALLGGSLEVESAPDQGTRTTLTVPIPPSASPQPKESTSGLSARSISPASDPGAIRILVADDHTVVRKGLVELLQKVPGLAVVGEAANGLHAIDQARQLRPDVVLMDVTMPQMNGIDATRLLLSEMPRVRVIGLSMHAHEMATLMQAAGAIRYLAKDGQIEDLIKAIREVCLQQANEP
jgi:signal transduction histidine kinase/ActR/RegA family two-component response regulator